MTDVILWLTASGTTLVAYGFGSLVGRRHGRRAASGPRPPALVCGCKHPLATHDPQTNRCHEQIKGRPTRWDIYDDAIDWEYVQCPCRQYTGPVPIDQVFQPRFALPEGDS